MKNGSQMVVLYSAIGVIYVILSMKCTDLSIQLCYHFLYLRFSKMVVVSCNGFITSKLIVQLYVQLEDGLVRLG